jgi:hypothetical protein
MTQQTQDVHGLRGRDLIGRDDAKLGTIEEIYLDTETDQPEWALVTIGLFGTKQSFVPISGMSREGDRVSVPFDNATVKDAPKVDPDGQLSEREERELYRHYGLDYGRTDDVRDPDAVGRDTSEPITDANAGDAMDGPDISEEEHEVVLHEEEPVAEKRAVPKERVRLDKDAHTEEREVSETLRKEEIEVDDAQGSR